MTVDRRAFLGAALGLAVGGLDRNKAVAEDAKPGSVKRLGIVIHSYGIRSRLERESGFTDPLTFVAFCRERGAAGVQLPLGTRDAAYAKKLRALVETAGMFLEGSTRPPKDRADQDRFEAEIRTARAAGATVVRSVLMAGRRYEVFTTLEQYRGFEKSGKASLELAKPILERHQVTLAIENHKDHRADELAALLRSVGSERIGVCVDTGNNVALLEDPIETTKILAPYAVACHLKDMAVQEMSEGFLLSEVPLGEGFLDLKTMVSLLQKARPGIHFTLEMITRDPLRVPCLTEKYWATFPHLSGRVLARALTMVRKRASQKPLPRISNRSAEEQLRIEEENVRRSLAYANENLLR